MSFFNTPDEQADNLFTVIIPTYRRPGPLLDCIRSLVEGNRQPDEVVVIGREGDRQSLGAPTGL